MGKANKKVALTVEEVILRNPIPEERIHRKLIRYTPAMAAEMQLLDEYLGDRDEVDANVARLVDAIETGYFSTGSIGVAYKDGKKIRVDGKHQTKGVLETGKSIWVVWHDIFLDDGAGTLHDAYLLFIGAKERTRSNVSKSIVESMGLGKEYGISQNSAGLFGAIQSMAYCLSIGDRQIWGRRHITKLAQLSELIAAHGDELVWLKSLNVFTKYGRHLKRSHVLLAMILSYRKDPDVATEFWHAVYDGSLLHDAKKDHVVQHLREFLTTVVVSQRAKKGVAAASERELYYTCVFHWNCFRRGIKTIPAYDENNSKFPEHI